MDLRSAGEAPDVVLNLGPYRFGPGSSRAERRAPLRRSAVYSLLRARWFTRIAYGRTHFASKAGSLAGNHFLTITSGMEHLPEIGRLVLWQGAQPLRIDAG